MTLLLSQPFLLEGEGGSELATPVLICPCCPLRP